MSRETLFRKQDLIKSLTVISETLIWLYDNNFNEIKAKIIRNRLKCWFIFCFVFLSWPSTLNNLPSTHGVCIFCCRRSQLFVWFGLTKLSIQSELLFLDESYKETWFLSDGEFLQKGHQTLIICWYTCTYIITETQNQTQVRLSVIWFEKKSIFSYLW